MKQFIRIFTLSIILCFGGMQNGAWGKVTYHILSLPMSTKQRNGTNNIEGSDINDFRTNVRVEVLRCVSSTLTVGLPDEYKSPLATNYRYYTSSSIAITGPSQLYGYNNTTYYFYNIKNNTGTNTTNNEDYGDGAVGDENTPTSEAVDAGLRLTPGAVCSDNIDIYVTYDNKASSDIDLGVADLLNPDLENRKEYNIHLKDRMVVLNQKRQNRPGAVLDGQYTSTQLASDAFSWITSAGIGNGDGYRHFIFKFGGNDPYNVTIFTAFDENYTYRGTGQADFFTKYNKDRDKYTQKDVYKEYRGSSFFSLMGAEITSNMWLSSEANTQWLEGGSANNANGKTVPGFFKGPNDNKSNLYEMSPIFNSFAILNHKSGVGYALAGTKMNQGTSTWQPRASDGLIQYMDYKDNGNNITIVYKADASACKVGLYEVRKYIFRVVTPFGNNVDATIKWSDYAKDESITTSLIPDELRRKYTSFTGNFYADAAHNTAVTTFEEAQTNCSQEDGKYVIYVDYTVLSSLPFTAITAANQTTGYTTATWYQMTDKDSSGKKIKWDATNSVFKNNGDAKDYTLESDFAFIGDPYELRIINRKLTVDNSRNVFVGSSSRTTATDLTILNDPGDGTEGVGFKWEIPYDAISGNFVLREFKSSNAYWNWNTAEGNTIQYNTSDSTRIKVMALPKIDYVYHIINSAGNEAVKATESQEVGIALNYSNIPEIIRSPFIDPTLGATITFSYTKDGTYDKTNASYNPGADGYNIYVRYDLTSLNATYAAYIDGSTSFNVRLNGEYIYYDSSSETIKSTSAVVSNSNYEWKLGGSDPYAMTIQNVGSEKKYVTVADWATGTISWSESEPTSKFIIKGTSSVSVYEVMAATGDDTDAATTYYNIGRYDANTVMMYSNSTYAHGYSQLRFQLTPLSAHDVTYHLIDKAGTDLIQVKARHAETDAPYFPDDYRSPLVATYHYYSDSECSSSITEVGSNTAIYVTYDTGTDYDLQNKKIMYLLKYEMGTPFKAEDGSDGLETDDVTPVYPYCNGDCNFFVYGQAQYDLQQQGAASTRTRWAWFLESANNDPYHVKICSRQTETYNGDEARAYFHTYQPSDYTSVVTTLTWPGISGVAGTEYMVLGSEGQFRLVTTYGIDLNNDGDILDSGEDVRYTVNSFEQYWKTWDTIRKKVLGDSDATASQSDPNTVPETPAAPTASAAGVGNRTYLTGTMGWHSYEQWAYAKRWNGYNISGKTSKGWEIIEHWYQTVQMGEGYFDLVPITIDPALILLDQHGWEIMRKPLPSSADDPELETKHAALRVYDSPMVKEYHFWTKASKRSGFHQYYSLSQQVSVDGVNYTSTSLGSLPPIDATNVKDAKGNVYDQYVTYVVKDEYVQSLGEPFLIEQGSNYVSTTDGSTITTTAAPTGGMSQHIIDNIENLTAEGSLNSELWYLKPNADIDIEMGYYDETKYPGGYAHSWTNDYTVTDFSESGFDPYNIQISSVKFNTKYFVTNASTGFISEGVWVGNGSAVSLNTVSAQFTATGHDSRSMPVTNATFMAVQDESGNMQLMPRFDQTRRMKDFETLTTATEDAATYTTLYRPLVYNYMIIDNEGNESLRYQSGGDLTPQTPEWFKSQLAKNFKYYKTAPTYDSENKTLTVSDEITEESSLAGAGLTTAGSAGNDVYVRYSYDEDADVDKVLQGKWLTMTLNGLDAQYTTVSETAGIYSGTKPTTVDGDAKTWQWKFLATPQSDPDPYAVCLYNRDAGSDAITVNSKTKFALLSWYDGSGIDANAYTLAVAGTESYTYDFVNGASMSSSVAATTSTESNFKSTSCSYNNTDAKIVLTDDVEHTFTYKVYTNDNAFAVSAEQGYATVVDNGYEPTLPEEIRSPLLNSDQFRYYNKDNFTFDTGNIATADTTSKALDNLYGLYDDEVIVRYTAYDLLTTEYKVPNVKTTVDSKVARGEDSNDASLDINGDLIYNIIWYNDNMMKKGDGDAISSDASHALDGDAAYVWQFEGNDPYAIKIKHKNSGNYAVGESSLAASATSTFMLLPANDGWEYGVLAKTGGSRYQLSGYGNTLADTEASPTPETPTKFIIFGLSTHKVIYHLVIANIGDSETIPYHDGTTLNESYAISGSTMRDLTTGSGATYQLGSTINGKNYCVDDGHITLGDPLAVPDALSKPNCKYFFYVGGIYDDETCNTANESLNTTYKGHQITKMGTEPDLVGKTVVINIVYAFDDGLPTNNGANFVIAATGTQWYTMETSDETPYLARFAYGGTGVIGAAEGRDPHYTNEFLWKPVGDPYGFKMYNRYVYKNVNLTDMVMTTAESPAAGASLTLENNNNAVYELEAGNTDGYFFVRPMLNTNVAIYNNAGTITLSSSNATEWTFGLNEAQLKPYYDRAGYVGGLNATGVTAYKDANGNLQTIQGIVYNDDYIVSYAQGYYRLHNLPNSDGITTPRYMSGYLHDIEKTADSGNAIPMHFYSRKGVSTTFETLGSGFTSTAATHGQISVLATEYDPSTIFRFTGTADAAQIQTQGLNVIENKMGTGTATNFHITDIGGATVVIHDGDATPSAKKYLYYNGTNIYDIGYDSYTNVTTLAEKSKWCMEPANKTGLYIETHSGGEEAVLTDLWYYSSYCVPFDMLIQNKNEDDGDGKGVHSSNAYTCVAAESPWSADGLHPKPIGKYNTGTYANNDYFVPAGTPVLFSTKRASSYIKATIPTTTPSTSIETIFSAKYLEQLLTGWDNSSRVYVFGPKMEGTMTLNTSTGEISAVLPSLGNTNVGFHINANPNKELGMTKASWTRNNYYVLHNRIYYKSDTSGASARGMTRSGIDFVPVFFDDQLVEPEEYGNEEKEEEELTERREYVGDGCVYDMQGRRVANTEQVLDGTWKQRVAPGIYIINGKKVSIR